MTHDDIERARAMLLYMEMEGRLIGQDARAEINQLCDLAQIGLEGNLIEAARVGSTIFHAGISERLVIERAQREYRYHLMLEQPSTDIAAWPKPDQEGKDRA